MSKQRRDPAFMHAHDPSCRVCSTDPVAHFQTTAAPLAPHLKNPETKGHNWYHGTHGDWDDDQRETEEQHGGRRNIPEGGLIEGPEELHPFDGHRAEDQYGGKHWNTDLGSHWTSLKHVAHEQFSGGPIPGGSPSSRVATASLHMANPKHYGSEHDLTRHAINWAHENGHHYITPTSHGGDRSREDDERQDFIGSGQIEDDPEGRFAHIPSVTGEYGRRQLDYIDRHGPSQYSDPSTQEIYLGAHPYRHEITTGFVKHLKDQGHDGIVYGNEHEGPHQHPCAIAFHDTPITQHKWEWTRRDKNTHRSEDQLWPKQPEMAGQQQLPFAVHGLLQHFGGVGDDYSLDGLKLHYEKQPTLGGEKHVIHARLPDRGAPIGSLSWVGKDGSRQYKPGEITWVQVGRGYDGKGVARKMLEHAQQLHDAGHVDTLPMHSDDLTRDGRGFVNSVSDGSDVYEPHNWENHDHGYEDATKARPRLRKKDFQPVSILQHFGGAAPTHIDRAVNSFYRHPGYEEFGEVAADPEQAHGFCEGISHAYADHANSQGSRTHVQDYVGREGHFKGYGHTVAVSDGHVIDWTHRQIDPEAGFPHIEPLSSFEQKWRPVHSYGDDPQSHEALLQHFAAPHPATRQDWFHGGSADQGSLSDDRSRDRWLHLGTERAAFDRITPDSYIESGKLVPDRKHNRVMRVRLAPGTRVCPRMHEDEMSHYPDIDYSQSHDYPSSDDFTGERCVHPDGGEYDAHQYINAGEDKGSTSLVVRPSKVRVVEDMGRHPAWSQTPEAKTAARIYRAAPAHVNEIRPGDWVAKDYGYAAMHADGMQDASSEPWHVIHHDVPEGHITWAGSDKDEWHQSTGERREFFYTPPEVDAKTAHVLDTWQPTDRLFAPTNGSLDPRLFDGDKIRPEVRDYVMGRLAAWWDGRYADWRTWSKVYIAGSSISEWWADKSQIQSTAANREVDPKYRLNDDLDTLIGVEYKGLVAANPQFAGMSPKMVSAHLNAELREHCNLEGVYLNVPASEVPEWEWAGDPEDGKVRVGPWSSTFYVNPNSYDIRAIKPYAAYNLTDDEWAVRPVSEPTGHKFSPTEWYYFEGVAQQVKGALALPEPARTNRSRRIWEHIHSSRSGAFGPHGQGVFDYRNAVEKFLSQHPDHLWDRLVEARFGGQSSNTVESANIATHGSKDASGMPDLRAGQGAGGVRPETPSLPRVSARAGVPPVSDLQASESRGTLRAEGVSLSPVRQPTADGAGQGAGYRPDSTQVQSVQADQADLRVQGRMVQAVHGPVLPGATGQRPREEGSIKQAPAQLVLDQDLRHHFGSVRSDAGSARGNLRDLPSNPWGIRSREPLRGSQSQDGSAESALVRPMQPVGSGPGGRPGVRREGDGVRAEAHAVDLDQAGLWQQLVDARFPDQKTSSQDHEVTYHLTDNPHFALNPDHQPEDNALSIRPREHKGLYTAERPSDWTGTQGYVRPYVAEIHSPKGVATDERWGGEKFIPAEHFDKVKVHRVIPLDAHEREAFGEHGRIESHHGSEFDSGKPIARDGWDQPPRHHFGEGYHYVGPDVRDMTPEQHTQHYNRWKGYMTGERGFGHNEFDDAKQTLAEPKDEDFDEEGMFIRRDQHGQKIAGANGDLPEGLILHHGGPGELPDDYPYKACDEGEREVRARIGDKTVGQIKWLTSVNPNANVTEGHITRAAVHPDYQRRGVATEMLRRAQEVDPRVHHSQHLTDDGAGWAAKTSSRIDPTTLHPSMNVYRDSGMGGVGEDRSVVGYVSTDALRKMHGNETDRAGVERHRESLRNGEGFTDPAMVIFDPKTHDAYLGEGNHRVQAAHEEGISHVPVRVVRGGVSNPAAQHMEHASTPYKGHMGEDYWPSDIHPSHIFHPDEVLDQAATDGVPYGHDRSHEGQRTGGRGRPDRRRVPDGDAGPDQEPGSIDDLRAGIRPPAARPLTLHPKVTGKDMKRMSNQDRDSILATMNDLAQSAQNVQTHKLTGPLSGWYSTKASRGHRITHQPDGDGGIFIGHVGLHNYQDAINRLSKAEPSASETTPARRSPRLARLRIREGSDV